MVVRFSSFGENPAIFGETWQGTIPRGLNRFDEFMYLESLKKCVDIPRKTWYRAYLQTQHWRDTRKERLKLDGGICVNCGKKKRKLEVHHKQYRFWKEDVRNDLISLCRKCHEFVKGPEYKERKKRFIVDASKPLFMCSDDGEES